MPCQTACTACHTGSLAATALQHLAQRTLRATCVAKLQRQDKNPSRTRWANSPRAVNAFDGVISVRSGHAPQGSDTAAPAEHTLRLTAERQRRPQGCVDKSPTERDLTRPFSVACWPRTPARATRDASQRTRRDAPYKLGSLT
ncbi:hypothetical protein GCM10023097_01250 [Streptomyces collinus]